MTTAAQRENQKRGLFIILGIIALGALLLIAAAAMGYAVGIPFLDNLFGNAATGGGAMAAANSSVRGGTGGGGATASNSGCFLGLICLNANADADGNRTNVSVDGDGVNANSN
jgi:hypothetical protein